MKPSAVLETALYVDDLAKAETFYGQILGLEFISRADNRHVFFRCGEGVLLLFNPAATSRPLQPGARYPVPPHGTNGPGHVCFAATADEINAWHARLEEKNVHIEADFRWPGGGRSIYFRDPAGNSLEFAERAIWERL